MDLVVLAAGIGRRYGGLKQLEPVGPGGASLLEYSIYDALRAGFDRVILVVRRETERQFKQAFATGMAKRIPLLYVHQRLDDLPAGFAVPAGREKPWGTGQAILAADAVVAGEFAVINADDFYGAESYVTLAEFLARAEGGESGSFAMLGFRVGDTLTEAGPASRGLCQRNEAGRLRRIVEIPKMWKRGEGGLYTDADGREVIVGAGERVSMNFWGFRPLLFPELRRRFEEFLQRHGEETEREFLLPDVIQAMIDEGRVEVEVLDRTGSWCGITYPEDRPRVAAVLEELVAQGVYPQALWS